MPSEFNSKYQRWFLVLGWLVPAIVFFGPVLLSGKVFAFRDVQHYYMPLFRTVHSHWQAGNLPLWNELEERGRPLLADPTASVWYPGQLAFFLPFSFATNLKLYLIGHTLLAYATMYYSARRLRLGPSAATLASLSYVFGGSILFQCCNPPYLIGAAWLPLGVWSVYDTILTANRQSFATLAMVLAMMVIGGDPQTAFLLGLAGCMGTMIAWLPLQSKERGRAVIGTLARLAAAGAIAAGISAAQWIPTLVWTLRSERIAGHQQTSIEQPSEHSFSWEPTPHDSKRYEFSVGPWRWIELLWPNVGGKPLPQNSRWMSLVPAEGKYWTPTLYMGVAPALLALMTLRLRRGRLLVRWLSWIAVIAVLGSLGSYGLGWMVNQLSISTSGYRLNVNDETGGLYWALVHLVPGFGLFRYPAKLWTWCALALSLLAGRQLEDRIHQQRPIIPSKILAAYAATSGLGIATLCAVKPWIGNLVASAETRTDLLFGPLQVDLAWSTTVVSFCHALIVAGLLRAAMSAGVLRQSLSTSGLLVVAITLAELSVAHQWLVPHAHDEVAARPQSETNAQGRLLRQQPSGWYPREWAKTSSPHRLEDCLRWDRLTAKPKYPQLDGWDSLASTTSFSSLDQAALMRTIEEVRQDDFSQFMELLERLSVDQYFGVPSQQKKGATVARIGEYASDYEVWRTTKPLPRAWLSDELTRIDPAPSNDVNELAQRTKEALCRDTTDFARRVIIEATPQQISKATRHVAHTPKHDVTPAPNRCKIHERNQAHLTVDVQLDAAAWVVINESYAPGWCAEMRTGERRTQIPVLRANRVMRAVYVGPGIHQIEFTYRPRSVDAGMGVSLLTLTIVFVGLVAAKFVRRPS